MQSCQETAKEKAKRLAKAVSVQMCNRLSTGAKEMGTTKELYFGESGKTREPEGATYLMFSDVQFFFSCSA